MRATTKKGPRTRAVRLMHMAARGRASAIAAAMFRTAVWETLGMSAACCAEAVAAQEAPPAPPLIH